MQKYGVLYSLGVKFLSQSNCSILIVFFSGITDIEAITVNWLCLIFSQRTLKKNLNFKVFVLHSEFKIARIGSPYIPSYVSLWSINSFLIQKNKALIRRNQCWDKFRLTVCEIRLTVPFYLWIFFILPHYLNITH